MTEDQKIIERNEFGCEDGHKALTEIFVRVYDQTWGDSAPESRDMVDALREAIEALEYAASRLSEAYDAVGTYEKHQRRKEAVDV